jgi:hypothetical protein
LRPGGRIAFTTIYIAPGVSERDYRRASRIRGYGAAERRAMTELLETAGFVDVRERDVTRAFARTTRAYGVTADRHRDALVEAWGEEQYRDVQHDRAATLALIDDGVLRRGMFVGRRPPASRRR